MFIRQQTDQPTILIADDDPLILRLVAVALVPEGYDVITASNGRQALAASRAHPGPIQLLLSDVQMPEMSGPELCKEIRSERPEIICILMSGNVSAASVGEEMRFIEKPFTTDSLRCRTRELLQSHTWLDSGERQKLGEQVHSPDAVEQKQSA